MKRTKSKVEMSLKEAKLLLEGQPGKVDELQQLVLLTLPRKKRKKKKAPRPKRFHLSDRQQIRLLRVDAEIAAKENLEALVLRHWAMMREATTSVDELYQELYLIEALKAEPKLLAWTRHAMRQAVLRGDAETDGAWMLKGEPQAPPEAGKKLDLINQSGSTSIDQPGDTGGSLQGPNATP